MRRKKTPPISSINVVPYLDVLLVLLVIFMITAPLFNQGIIALPTVGKTPLESVPQAALEIQLTHDGDGANPTFTLINHENNQTNKDLSEQQLLDELGKYTILAPDKLKNQPIIIAADKTLTFQQVFDLVGVLRDNGYHNLALEAVNDS